MKSFAKNKLQKFMKENQISTTDLATYSNLSPDTVKSVYYGKSSKKEHLERIVTALGLHPNFFNSPSQPEYFENFDYHILQLTITCVLEVLEENNVSIVARKWIQNNLHSTYQYIMNTNPSKEELKAYMKGKIESDIISGNIIISSDELV